MDNEIEELAKKRKCQTSTQIESKKLRPVEGEDEMSAESTSQRDEHAEEEPQEIREEQGLVDENDRKAEASKSKKDENVGQTDREEKQCVDDENGDHKKVEASNSKKDENVVQTEGEEKQCVDDGNGDQKKIEDVFNRKEENEKHTDGGEQCCTVNGDEEVKLEDYWRSLRRRLKSRRKKINDAKRREAKALLEKGEENSCSFSDDEDLEDYRRRKRSKRRRKWRRRRRRISCEESEKSTKEENKANSDGSGEKHCLVKDNRDGEEVKFLSSDDDMWRESNSCSTKVVQELSSSSSDYAPNDEEYEDSKFNSSSPQSSETFLLSDEEGEDEEETEEEESDSLEMKAKHNSSDFDSDLDSNFDADSMVDYLSFDSPEEDEDEGVSLRVSQQQGQPPCAMSSSAHLQNNSYRFFRAPPRPLPPRIPFTGITGLLKVPSNATPYGFFEMLADGSIDLTVKETNKQGEKLKTEGKLKRFRPVTKDELKRFLGIFFHMGYCRSNRVRTYWAYNKSDYGFSEFYRNMNMSCNRFLQILHSLHFNADYDILDEDKLAKIRPLLDLFNNRMESVYGPGRELFIPQPLVLWKGSLLYRQFVKDSTDPFGVKTYSLLEPGGLILKFVIHSGWDDKDTGGKNHLRKVVGKLMEGKRGKGHSVFVERYYNSVELVSDLLNEETYCTGAVSDTDRHIPKDMLNKKLNHGKMIQKFSNKNICIIKWNGDRRTYFVSSEYCGRLGMTKTGLRFPSAMVKYFHFTNGSFDYEDEVVPYYSCKNKILHWYLKIGLHIFQLMLLNAYHLYKRHRRSHMTFFKFKVRVIEQLIGARKWSI